MRQIPAQRRPHYPPVERLSILELRSARSWSQAQTVEYFPITPATIVSWMSRLDEEGPHALVRTPQPANKFPDFVGYLVRRLKVLCPTMGKTRIANVLCRAGFHLDWLVRATEMTRVCSADFDTNGLVEAADLTGYLGAYQSGTVAADLDDGSGTGLRDGGVTIDDLLYFLGRYGAGC